MIFICLANSSPTNSTNSSSGETRCSPVPINKVICSFFIPIASNSAIKGGKISLFGTGRVRSLVTITTFLAPFRLDKEAPTGFLSA